ncbi:unnamed protein product [Calypogeia fissa]
MEGEQCNKELPEHLVENIIARIPFPSIFKARTLSKEWLARFSSTESHQTDRKVALCPTVVKNFQQLVSERSSTWEASGPVCICYNHDECHARKLACGPGREQCYAFNPLCATWQKIPSISPYPEVHSP